MGSNYHYSPKDYYHWISFLMESSTTLQVENSNFAISIFKAQLSFAFVSLYSSRKDAIAARSSSFFLFFVQKVGQEEKYKQYYEYFFLSRPSKFKCKLSHLLRCSKSVTHLFFHLYLKFRGSVITLVNSLGPCHFVPSFPTIQRVL